MSMSLPISMFRYLYMVRSDTALLPREKLLALVIASHINEQYKFARLRMDTLISETSTSKCTVKRALAGLIAKGYVSTKPTGRSSMYYLSQPPDTSRTIHLEQDPGSSAQIPVFESRAEHESKRENDRLYRTGSMKPPRSSPERNSQPWSEA